MAVMDVVKYGDPILRKKCEKVTDFSKLPELVNDIFDTMYEEEGIGLAANQVGIDLNLMVIDVTHTDEAEETNVFVNCQIIESWGESVFEEGCLSIPEVRLEVKRPEFIKIKFQDIKGVEKEEEFTGLLGRAIQHEIDHLNGIFIVDKVSPLVRMQVKKQLKEIEVSSKKKTPINRKESFVL
ncbi:MAG TPA: peptide deformylase [Candidatus Marinimicrobia bacterium]|jgi:peptide deformylase|nr:peptide deformylase [Candidatus Neomarinimicrobiota bacterium]|tara:strand:+ start:402 stop:947 length:546 start_codon:yes stop_codon:yes gene_type:complete